jgi:glycine/D-amino acid oxidase-like deaminating enzyme
MWGVALGPLTGKMLAASITCDSTPTIMRRFDHRWKPAICQSCGSFPGLCAAAGHRGH